MSSKITPIRLNEQERDMLAYLTSRENSEVSNAGELFRLLLHREFNRCKGIAGPKFSKVASEMRTGRPGRFYNSDGSKV